MFKWLKNLYEDVEETNKDSFMEKKCREKPTIKGVSEPVISFVKFVKEHPENFLLKRTDCRTMIDEYKLVDKRNRKVYKFMVNRVRPDWLLDFFHGSELKGCLTVEERYYLANTLKEELENVEQTRVNIIRKKYMDLYC